MAPGDGRIGLGDALAQFAESNRQIARAVDKVADALPAAGNLGRLEGKLDQMLIQCAQCHTDTGALFERQNQTARDAAVLRADLDNARNGGRVGLWAGIIGAVVAIGALVVAVVRVVAPALQAAVK